MRHRQLIRHEFIELLPAKVEPETLYVSIKYKCMAHLCFCGCGRKVITPLSPTGWQLTFNGREVSVYPSIGNWNLPCRSHYWISKSRIEWAEQWSDNRIALGFERDREEKLEYYRPRSSETPSKPAETLPADIARNESIWLRLKKWVT